MNEMVPSSALARELGITRRTLSRWVARGATPTPRIFNGRLYFRRDEIEAWKKTWGSAMVSKSAVRDNYQEISRVQS